MKFAIAVHGTRGDVEPAAAVALELQRRGHEVRMAVPPNLVAFTESVGLSPVVPYGPDSHKQLEAETFRNQRNWRHFLNPRAVLRHARDYLTDGWPEMSETLKLLATDADLILTGTTYQEVAANVAELYRIPLAALHYFPFRPNTHVLPVRMPLEILRPAWAVSEWAYWQLSKPAEDQQRKVLGLNKSRHRSMRRIVDSGALEVQAYEPALFPGLAVEWGGERPIVGAITLELPTSVDDAVTAWIAAGPAPIYFGFGSMPVEDPAEGVAMITDVCNQLGQRALICSGTLAVKNVGNSDQVMVVPSVNHSAVFPLCRAAVHHGGAGTTAASVRAGIPTLVLWVGADQPVWARQVRRIGVGTYRRYSTLDRRELLKALREVLQPRCAVRAREVAATAIKPPRSVAAAADLVERAVANHGNTESRPG